MTFDVILGQIANLLEKKNHDYGDSYTVLRDKYGPVAFYVRIADKLNRIEQLDRSDQLVDNESIIDTLRDMIGYATLELRYRLKEVED